MKISKSKFSRIVKEELAKLIVEKNWPEVPDPIPEEERAMDENIFAPSKDKDGLSLSKGMGMRGQSPDFSMPDFAELPSMDSPPTADAATAPAKPKKKFGHRIKKFFKGKDKTPGKAVDAAHMAKITSPEYAAKAKAQREYMPTQTNVSTAGKKYDDWKGGIASTSDAANAYSKTFDGEAGDPYKYRETSPGVFQAKKAGAKSWGTIPKGSKGYKSVQNLAAKGKSLWTKPAEVPPEQAADGADGAKGAKGTPKVTPKGTPKGTTNEPAVVKEQQQIKETLARWQELIK